MKVVLSVHFMRSDMGIARAHGVGIRAKSSESDRWFHNLRSGVDSPPPSGSQPAAKRRSVQPAPHCGRGILWQRHTVAAAHCGSGTLWRSVRIAVHTRLGRASRSFEPSATRSAMRWQALAGVGQLWQDCSIPPTCHPRRHEGESSGA
jgi:hypothetical protein